MRRIVSFFITIILCITCTMAFAARKTVEKDQYYIGAMRVVNCREYVSLRATPDKTGTVLAKVPLGSIVLYCSNNYRQYASGNYRNRQSCLSAVNMRDRKAIS